MCLLAFREVEMRKHCLVGLLSMIISSMIAMNSAQSATAYQGYTFFASGATAYLVNMSGTQVHTWKASGTAQTCAYLLEDGSALFPIYNSACTAPQHNGAHPHGRFQKISWDGVITWDYKFCDATARPGYDVEPMPNGNILIPADASAAAKIFEVQPTGATTGDVVWQCALPNSLAAVSGTYINSVSYNPQLDMILVDLQESNRKLVVIDHSVAGGSVVYTYKVGTTGRVHAAAWVHKYFLGTSTVMPDADTTAMRLNNLLVVYNGGDQAVEVNMTTNTRVKALSYTCSDHEGSVQRLPNGNTLVTPGGSKTITELDDNGSIVGTITAPGSIHRAYRYGFAYAGVARLTSAVREPLSAQPGAVAAFTCYQTANACRLIKVNPDGTPFTARIFSVDGKTVCTVSATGAEAMLPTGNLATGMYWVQVHYAAGTFRTSLVIVH
jgi:hypothetical protein